MRSISIKEIELPLVHLTTQTNLILLILEADANYASEAILLFNDINKDENMEITWTQFLDYLLSISQIKTSQKLELGCHHISAVPHVMVRVTLRKILTLSNERAILEGRYR